jgi:hypothetical protein
LVLFLAAKRLLQFLAIAAIGPIGFVAVALGVVAEVFRVAPPSRKLYGETLRHALHTRVRALRRPLGMGALTELRESPLELIFRHGVRRALRHRSLIHSVPYVDRRAVDFVCTWVKGLHTPVRAAASEYTTPSGLSGASAVSAASALTRGNVGAGENARDFPASQVDSEFRSRRT